MERLTDRPLPSVDALERGAIIGVVEVVDCVRDSGSPWAEPGSWHWCLAGARALEPVPWRGRLGLWPAPPGMGV